MIDALIDDGDVVVIKPIRCAKNGETVVVWFKKKKKQFFGNSTEKVTTYNCNLPT